MLDYTANMTSYEQAIELVRYLLAYDADLEIAAETAERRFTTPKQVLIDLFTTGN
jgi:hypothetical protein